MKAPVENRMEAAGASGHFRPLATMQAAVGRIGRCPGLRLGRSVRPGQVLCLRMARIMRGSPVRITPRAFGPSAKKNQRPRKIAAAASLRVETLWRRHNSRSRIAAAKFRGACACRPRRSIASIHFHFTHIPADCVRQSLRPFRREMSAAAAAVERTCNGQQDAYRREPSGGNPGGRPAWKPR